jgi:hypothetical protein
MPEDGVHVLAGVRKVLGRARAQPGQVPQRFFLRIRNPHLGDGSDREHLDKHPGVPPIGFDPLRRRLNHAVDPRRPQFPDQDEPGRS